jgi:hypothetical protein
MKKIIIVAFILITSAVSGQFYQFNYFTESYADYNDGVVVDMIEICDGNLVAVPLGFDFPIFEYSINSVLAHQVFLMEEFEYNSQFYGVQLFPLGAGYTCSNDTELSYKTVGSSGNRIFKFQWKNLGIWNDGSGLDRINIQCWLYEQTATIEYRFGQIQITQADSYFTDLNGGFTAVVNYVNPSSPVVINNSQYLVGSANTPISEVFNPNTSTSMIGHPSMDMVYQFALPDAGINELVMSSMIYPNPANEIIHLKFESEKPTKMEFIALNGKTVLDLDLANLQEHFNIKELNPGIYFLKVTFANRIDTIKFVKN